MLTIYIANDQTVTVQIRDISQTPPVWVNAAALTATLKDTNGNTIGAPITGSYIVGSDGTYQFRISATMVTGLAGSGTLVVSDGSSLSVNLDVTYSLRTVG